MMNFIYEMHYERTKLSFQTFKKELFEQNIQISKFDS